MQINKNKINVYVKSFQIIHSLFHRDEFWKAKIVEKGGKSIPLKLSDIFLSLPIFNFPPNISITFESYLLACFKFFHRMLFSPTILQLIFCSVRCKIFRADYSNLFEEGNALIQRMKRLFCLADKFSLPLPSFIDLSSGIKHFKCISIFSLQKFSRQTLQEGSNFSVGAFFGGSPQGVMTKI